MGSCGSSLKHETTIQNISDTDNPGPQSPAMVQQPPSNRVAQQLSVANAEFAVLPNTVNLSANHLPALNPSALNTPPLIEEALYALSDPVFILDQPSGRIIYMNGAAKARIGHQYLNGNIEELIPKQYKSRYRINSLPGYSIGFFDSTSAASSVGADKQKRKVPLLLQADPQKPAIEILVEMHISPVSNGLVVHIIEEANLLHALQQQISQQRAIAHEGRNVRLAAMSHTSGSKEGIEKSISALRKIMSQPMPADMAEELGSVLKEMEQAYYLQGLAIECGRYVSIAENYILSAESAEVFAINSWVNSMIDMLASKQAGIAFEKEGLLIAPEECIVRGHKAVLLYSFVNILQNAIKFTMPKRMSAPSTQLHIVISLTESNGVFSLSISDNGIGMSVEQAATCLTQQHKKYNQSMEGNGSGLANIKAALDKIGGSILVNSTLGLGTRFILVIPLAIVPQSNQRVNYKSLRFLVVDDQGINRKIMAGNLKKMGVLPGNIVCSSSEPEAFELFKAQYQSGQGFDIVLTDLQMPGGDEGLVLIESIRRFEQQLPKVSPAKLIIISGTVLSEGNNHDKRFTLANGSLTKPYVQADINTLLSNPMACPPRNVAEIEVEQEEGSSLKI